MPKKTIEISSIKDLQRIANGPEFIEGHYVLTQDIDASETAEWNSDGEGNFRGFKPIGGGGQFGYDKSFFGTFDGQGHVITNLYINRPNRSNTGLFGVVGHGGKVQNLRLDRAIVNGGYKTGGIVGENGGHVHYVDVESIYVEGICYLGTGGHFNKDQVGGIVGFNTGTVSHALATGVVIGDSDVGAIVGLNWGNVYKNDAAVTVHGSGENVGGLVGHSYTPVLK